MKTPTLRRLTAVDHLPFPKAVRVGDLVFTSSIYPIDDSGRVVAEKNWLGDAGPSTIAVQTRHCLTSLKATLGELGSSLSNVVKVDVHLASASDFYELKVVWREFFPFDPPARLRSAKPFRFPACD
jgi:2-iminobutanoate/2-iminopropanoate deaminase